MISAENIVVSYWAIGPSFRRALLTMLDTAYKRPDMFKFIILTDHVSDFEELQTQNPKCIAVLDLNEQRAKYEWSFIHEPIPVSKTEREYASEFREILLTSRFSYGLHRFSVPWLIDHGYLQFILMDPDMAIGRRDITIQTWVDGYLDLGVPVVAYGCVHSNTENHLEVYTAVCDALEAKFPYIKAPRGIPYVVYTDGPFRFHNFNCPEAAAEFFQIWNFSIKYTFENIDLLNRVSQVGPVFYHDEFLLGIIYTALGISLGTIAGPAVEANHNIEHRYFAITQGNYKSALTHDEFLEINEFNIGGDYEQK